MLSVYLGFFLVGLMLSVVMGVAGGHHIAGFHGAHVGHVHHGATGQHLPLLNPLTVVAFVTGFGGVGYILDREGILPGLGILVIAFVGGCLVAGMIYWFFARMLKADASMSEKDYDLMGHEAHVSIPITADYAGEIKFELQGTIRSMGARTKDAKSLPKGTAVRILWTDRSMALVEEVLDQKEAM